MVFISSKFSGRLSCCSQRCTWNLKIDIRSHRIILTVRTFCVVITDGVWKNLSGIEAVQIWVAQKKYYDEQSKSCVGGNCYNYMQVITSIATHVGCARVRCYNGSIMISCNYNLGGI
ncbi:hypothetical protein HN51_030517 [Arachis hypogaea]|uniref:SCP domain-containing protein n=1 Tax=Arachis hypogaea TaxID=3818 RepID=A0A445BAZ3_ARAHY|nr:hypothetical protein Ahy_A10g050934 [Arachis hypogaea]